MVLVKTNKLYAGDLVDGDVASDVTGFLYDVDSLQVERNRINDS